MVYTTCLILKNFPLDNVFYLCKCALIDLKYILLLSLVCWLHSSDPVSNPRIIVETVGNSEVKYRVRRTSNINDKTNPLIAGYEVTRLGVQMIGEYVNAGRGQTVAINPAVPGARYRITAWALRNGTRSATPAVVYATTRETSECSRHVTPIIQYIYGGFLDT